LTRRKAVGTTLMIVLVLVVIIVGTVASVTLSAHQNNPSPATSSTSPSVYQVIESNLTLRGQTAVVPCIGFNVAGCPSASNASLSQVELIRYGGEFFYLSNQSLPGAAAAGGQPESNTTYAVWFNNSTVYCISPAHPSTNTYHENSTCPAQPYEPTTFGIPVTSSSSLNSSTGLRLNLSLHANSNGTLTVAFDEFNTLDHVNNVTASGKWSFGGTGTNVSLWAQEGCGPFLPAGYEVLRGNYGQNNFTEGTPLTLTAQLVGLFCIANDPTPYYAFQPLSDVAGTYQYRNIPSLAGIYNVTIDSSYASAGGWSGFWTGSTSQGGAGNVVGGNCPDANSTSGCPLVLNPFPLGPYTVVAADEWGQVVVLHFVVQDG
jgi:hypothetical protein